MKQQIGLGHYEGRGWWGFHHHATLSVSAYGILIAERAVIPPSVEPGAPFPKPPGVPEDYRPRGAADSS